MQGGSKTGKWDIVVSYQCEKLSTLLGTLWKADSKTDVAKFRRSTLRENNDFELQLGTPRLSFQAGQHGTAKLLIPIHGKVTTSYKLKKGGVWVEDKNIEPDVVSLPENVYTLTVTAPLKSVTGSVSELSTTDEKSVSFVVAFEKCKLIIREGPWKSTELGHPKYVEYHYSFFTSRRSILNRKIPSHCFRQRVY